MTELNQLTGKNPRNNNKIRFLVTLVGCSCITTCNGIIINSWTLAIASICVPREFPYPNIRAQYTVSHPEVYYNISNTIHRNEVAIAKVSSFSQ